MSELNVDTLIITKADKKTKPRMSKVVEKAVLLKQLSDLNITPPTPRVCAKKGEGEKVKKVKTPVVETPVVEIPVVEEVCSRIQPTFICKECDITFTSQILFNRHPYTIKHRVALQKLKKVE